MEENKFEFREFIISFLIGAILGALLGFGIWVKWMWEIDIWFKTKLLYSYPTANLFIEGGAVVGGLVSAFYKGSQKYW